MLEKRVLPDSDSVKQIFNFIQQLLKIYRFCDKIITAGFKATVAFITKSIGSMYNDGYGPIKFPDLPDGFNTIDYRKLNIHKDKIDMIVLFAKVNSNLAVDCPKHIGICFPG